MKLTETTILSGVIFLIGFVMFLIGHILIKKNPNYKPYNALQLIGGTLIFYSMFQILRETI